jgi:thioredoxin 1
MENEDQVKENNLSEQINVEEGPQLASEGNPPEPIGEASRPEPVMQPLADQGGRKSRKVILLAVAAIVVLAGAAAFYFLYLGHPSRQALASVNGQKITLEQFNKELAKVDNPLREMFREEPSQFLEGMVLRTLMLQEAKKQGLSVPAKTYKDKEAAKDAVSPEDSLIAELIKQRFSAPLTITQDEIKAFYAMYKDRMDGKPLAQMAPVIEQILQEAKQRQEFEKFVKGLRDSAKVEIKQDRLKKIAAKPPESDSAEDFKKALAGGKPVLVDFGANSCVPCRQMRPILKEVSKEYSEKAKVLVIDVYKFQDLARQYQVQLIPTLVFFDSKGKEVFRHLGAWEKESIVAKLKEIGMGA